MISTGTSTIPLKFKCYPYLILLSESPDTPDISSGADTCAPEENKYRTIHIHRYRPPKTSVKYYNK